MSTSLRVLLVEDSEDDALLLERELRRSDYDPRVKRVETPEAMKAALDREPWDLVIADYVLPRFSGPAALALLKESGLDLPFIVVSGTIGEDIAVATMKAGAHDYLMKDKLSRLAAAVARELHEADNRARKRELEKKVEIQTWQLQEAYAQLTQKVKELEGRDRLIRLQLSGPTPVQACEEILQQVVEHVLGIKRAIMYRPNETGDQLQAVAALEDPQSDGHPAVSLGEETSFVGQVFRDGQPYGTRSQAAVSLLYQEEAMGVLWVDGLPEEDREQATNTLWRLGQEAALVLWSARVTEDLESGHMHVDELLQLGERRL